jgi:hypothetical protein
MAQLSFRPNRAYPSIPTISGDVQSHTNALYAIREAIEIHERRTNNYLDSFVRVRELVDLGLVTIDGNIVVAPDDDADGSDTHHHDSLYIRLDGASPPATGSIDFAGGIGIFDPALTESVTFSHDGFDLVTTSSAAGFWYINGFGTVRLTGGTNLYLMAGGTLSVRDSTSLDGVSIFHDGTDGEISFSGADYAKIGVTGAPQFGFKFGKPMFILEQAAAEADVPGFGQLWVKNDAPNTLWFTDDAGNDIQLGAAGASDDTLIWMGL